ncbi:MAG: hypothetical protein ABIH37_03800 [archaeon]
MNFKETLEKVESSNAFINFKSEHPNAELCAGFFILDFLSNDNKQSVDYKNNENIFTFDINKIGEIFIKQDRLLDESTRPKLKKINPEIKVEVDELKSIVGINILDNGISAKLHKIIAVLQNYKSDITNDEDKVVWNLTCMLEQLIILNIIIDAETGKILKFERKSMMDMIKKK